MLLVNWQELALHIFWNYKLTCQESRVSKADTRDISMLVRISWCFWSGKLLFMFAEVRSTFKPRYNQVKRRKKVWINSTKFVSTSLAFSDATCNELSCEWMLRDN